jgi:hypothetical protein
MRCSVLVALAALALGCSTTAKTEWQRADGSPTTQAIRDLRAKDIADCATRMGAPTEGVQSAQSYSRAQVDDCMRSKGWRQVSASQP